MQKKLSGCRGMIDERWRSVEKSLLSGMLSARENTYVHGWI